MSLTSFFFLLLYCHNQKCFKLTFYLLFFFALLKQNPLNWFVCLSICVSCFMVNLFACCSFCFCCFGLHEKKLSFALCSDLKDFVFLLILAPSTIYFIHNIFSFPRVQKSRIYLQRFCVVFFLLNFLNHQKFAHNFSACVCFFWSRLAFLFFLLWFSQQHKILLNSFCKNSISKLFDKLISFCLQLH